MIKILKKALFLAELAQRFFKVSSQIKYYIVAKHENKCYLKQKQFSK